MYPVLFSLYQDITIHTYGFCILIGIITALSIAMTDRWSIVQQTWPVWDTLIIYLAAGMLIGSRLLYWAARQQYSLLSLVAINQGGFSILGGMLGASGALYIMSWRYQRSYVSLLDMLAVYTPCIQSFARIGCFLAGCCAGAPTSIWFSVWYPHDQGWCYSHPLQLYSALFYAIFFIVLYHFRISLSQRKGLLAGIYLLATVCERLAQDWFRAQPTFFSSSALFVDYCTLAALMGLGMWCIYLSSTKSFTEA